MTKPGRSFSTTSTPAFLPPPIDPLYLSIDSGVKKMRAAVLNDALDVVWVDEVDFDREMGEEYNIIYGSRTFGEEVTAPSGMRIKALDLLLEKLARECPDPSMMGSICAISGSGQQNAPYFLTPAFPTLLNTLPSHPNSRLSTLLPSHLTFSLAAPSNSHDASTSTQCAVLEASLSLSFIPDPELHTPISEMKKAHAQEFARRTGGRARRAAVGPQVMKVRETMPEVLEETGRVMLESTLLTSLFLGRIAPVDAADACETNLFDVVGGDWDDEILGLVMGAEEDELFEGGEPGASRLRRMLGEVEHDGGKSLGVISSYFVDRFGFNPECIVVPFTGDTPATFLSFNLKPKEVLVCLGVNESDTVIVPSQDYAPDAAHQIMLHPAPSANDSSECQYVTAIVNKDAGLGRSLVRDMYCNTTWDVFSRLVELVPHGGTIGLDDKCYSFFFPHSDAGVARGFVRFVTGARTLEFEDRKVNPRLLLETQFLSLRDRLARLYSSLALLSHNLPASPPTYRQSLLDPIGYDSRSVELLPARAIVVGGGAANPAMVSILSTILGAPAYVPVESESRGKWDMGPRAVKTASSALGAGYKACWGYAKTTGETASFAEFVRRRKESRMERSEGGRGGMGEREKRVKGQSGTRLGGSWGAPSPAPPPPRTVDDLTLVGRPDPVEFLYYGSMLREFVRLDGHLAKGYI